MLIIFYHSLIEFKSFANSLIFPKTSPVVKLTGETNLPCLSQPKIFFY